MNEGRHDEAAALFAAVLQETPDDPAAVAGWCRSIRRAGRTPEIRERFAGAASGAAPGAGTLLGQGYAEYYDGSWAQADALFLRAHQAYGSTGDQAGAGQAIYMAGAVALNTDRIELAVERLTESLKLRRSVGDREGTGRTLINLATAHLALGELAGAERSYVEAAAELDDWPAVQAQALTGLAGVRWDQGDLEGARTAYLELLPVFEALNDRAGMVDAALSLAILAEDAGRSQEAVEMAERAGAAAEGLDDAYAGAHALIIAANARIHLGDHEPAAAGFTRALELLDTIDRTSLYGSAWIGQGNLALQARDHASAMELFEKSRALFAELEEPDQEAIALSNIGVTLEAQGRWDGAARAYLEAYTRAGAAEDLEGQSIALTQLARVNGLLGKERDAEEQLEQALAIARELQDREQEADVLGQEGHLRIARADAPGALESFAASAALYEELDHPAALALARANQGDVLRRLGRRQEAIRAFEEARTLFEGVGDTQGVALTLLNLGTVALEEGRVEDAERVLERARKMQSDAANDEDLVDTLLALARARERSGETAPARNALTEAVEVSSRLLARAGAADLTVGLRAAAVLQGDRELAFVALAHHHARQGNAETAFEILQQGKALALRRQIRAAALSREGLPSALREEWGREQRRVAAATARLRRGDVAAGEREALLSELRAAEARAADILRRWEAQALAAQDPQEDRAFDVDALRAALDDGDVLIAVSLGEPVSYGWRVDAEVRQFELPGRAVLEEAAEALLRALDPKAGSRTASDAPAAALGGLLQPLLAGVAEGARIWWVPDGALSRAPFHALPADGGRRVAQRHETSILPSAALLPFLHGRRPSEASPGGAVLAMGDPSFGRATEEPGAKWGLAGEGSLRSLADDFQPLPWSGREARNVGRAHGRDAATVLTGTEAREEALKGGDLQKWTVVHLATHAVVDARDAGRSAVILAQDADPAEDGFLTVAEIASLRMAPGVVVLSACQSAGSRVVSGEGLQGLSSAFLAAGAQAVVASLWPVDDEAAFHFMDQLHGSLARGRTVAGAVRDARQVMMERSGPADWAAFVLIGDAQATPRPAGPGRDG